MQFTDSIRYLKGVGEQRSALYAKLGVYTLGLHSDCTTFQIQLPPELYISYTGNTPQRYLCFGSFRFDELHCKQDQYLGLRRNHILQACHYQHCFYYGIHYFRGS